MSESGDSKKIHPWHAGWWLPDLDKDDRQESCRRISDSSAPKPSYFVLIILSTLIASYGLVSNSTATVIGAMIVAPLMGPILGLALGTVLGDVRMFRRSLIAESSGAILVVLTGMLVAWTVGPTYIEFGAGEIAGRTRPTLFDFAIGLTAGLAGAYCTVHPGLAGSIAGVAIAVALVPPLAVTGLTGAGWLSGEVGFRPVFGSFMLFFTNLLTIELASGIIFYAAGFRVIKEGKTKIVFRRAMIVNSILLLLTSWFLTIQLTTLLRERYGLAVSKSELESALKDLPGSTLDSIQADLQKQHLTVRAVVGSRSDIEPPTVARFERRLSKAVQDGLPEVQVRLVVRTVNSTYATSGGYLFEPTRKGPDDDEKRAQALDLALRELISKYPGVDLVNFQLTPHMHPDIAEDSQGLTLTLSSPYEFGPRFVKDLENQLQVKLKPDPLFEGRDYRFLVKTLLIRNATSESAVAVEAPELRTEEERELAKRTARLGTLLSSALELNRGVKVTELHLRPVELLSSKDTPQEEPSPSPSPGDAVDHRSVDTYVAHIKLTSPQLISENTLIEARKFVEDIYRKETGDDIKITLDTSITLGSELHLDGADDIAPDPSSVPEQVPSDQNLVKSFATLVQKVPGATIEGEPELQNLSNSPGEFSLVAIVLSPKPLDNRTILSWQKSLLTSHPEVKSLELQVENRIGRQMKLTRLRQE